MLVKGCLRNKPEKRPTAAVLLTQVTVVIEQDDQDLQTLIESTATSLTGKKEIALREQKVCVILIWL